jgi:N-acetylneuraminic acid mutarotase
VLAPSTGLLMRRAGAAAMAAALVAALVAALAVGDNGDGPTNEASKAASGRWLPLAAAGLERTEVAAARVGRHIYVVGGFEERSGATTAAVERYDIRSDSWRRMASMPVGLNHPAAVAHRGKVYVHGGYRGRRDLSSATGALLRYDPRRNRWRSLRAAPTPRAAHALAAIGGRLYAAGGANADGSLRSMEIYDLRSRRWRRGPSFPGPPRDHTTGIASGGRFYVLAGREGSNNYTAAERYDPRRQRWERLPDMQRERGGIASVRLPDGRIVVFGGEDFGAGSTIREVELFNPRTRRWRRLPDLRTPRHGLGGAALGKRVYAIVGGPRPGFHFSDTIEFLDVR